MEVLTHGSTIYFALISGILFSLVLRKKGYHHFFKNKVKNVLAPYVISSIFYSLIMWKIIGFSPITDQATVYDIVYVFIYQILTGTAFFHLWYIPILLIMFVLTPLIARFLDTKNKLFVSLLILLPLLISRVWPEFSYTTLIYFIGSYSIGVLIGSHFEALDEWISMRKNILVFTILSLSITYYFLLMFDIKNVEVGILLTNAQESIIYLIRISTALIMLYFLKRLVTEVPSWVNTLANYSFAIYFLHMGFILALTFISKDSAVHPSGVFQTFIFGLSVFTLSLFLSITLTYGIKKMTGRHSRLLIGA